MSVIGFVGDNNNTQENQKISENGGATFIDRQNYKIGIIFITNLIFLDLLVQDEAEEGDEEDIDDLESSAMKDNKRDSRN